MGRTIYHDEEYKEQDITIQVQSAVAEAAGKVYEKVL